MSKVVNMLRDMEDGYGSDPYLYSIQLSNAIVRHDPAAADWIADQLLLQGGFLVPRSGVRAYGFRSEALRDQTLDAVRARFGWTTAEPVEFEVAALL